MPEVTLKQGTVPFQAEARLLQELGLRLVASPEVALVELIKNAYDADAPTCEVRFENTTRQVLVVDDSGHGITFHDFINKWMRIATSSKLNQKVSPKYKRALTGAKGIGRFAARYLGDYLELESVALDPQRQTRTRLKAQFDWKTLDHVEELSNAKIPYTLTRASEDVCLGTTLRIGKLRGSTSFVESRELRDNVLKMVSPLSGLDAGRFGQLARSGTKDPGFSLELPGDGPDQDVDLAKLLLGRYWARLTISCKDGRLHFRVSHSTAPDPKTLSVKVESKIGNGFLADVRYFPRRKGMFSNVGVDGRRAWRWIRENCGVAVIDHGFRIKPYGFRNNDWLHLDIDAAHNKREWATGIANKHFPVPDAKRGIPAENPVLYLPSNFQLVGAVFILSKRKVSPADEQDLIPAMDREGLIANEGADQLREFVRAGIEFLAHQDKIELERLAKIEARKIAKHARQEIQDAITHIEDSPTLVAGDKSRIIKQYVRLADRLDEHEKYSEQARRSLTTMSLLGVVAGFMTHESKAAVHELEKAVATVRTLAKRHPELGEIADSLDTRLKSFTSYVEYARLFVRNVRTDKDQPLNAAGQVRHVLNIFNSFAKERGIEILNEIPRDVTTPPLPVTVYSGILLNLYTNALKAIVAARSSIDSPRVCFRAQTDNGKHILEVLDNGIGIPPEVRKRIFDPLFTTTSDIGNPLGSGMGLGLTLVKQVASEFNGSVALVEPPEDEYSTCFRVEFPYPDKR